MISSSDTCRIKPVISSRMISGFYPTVLSTVAAIFFFASGCQLSHRPQFPVGDPNDITVRMGEKTTELADTHGVDFKNCAHHALQSVESLMKRVAKGPDAAEFESITKGDVLILRYDIPQKISLYEQDPPEGTVKDSDGFTLLDGVTSVTIPLDGTHTGTLIFTNADNKIIQTYRPSTQLSRRSLAESLATSIPMMPDTE